MRLDQLRPTSTTATGLGSMRRGDLVTRNTVWHFEGAEDLVEGNFVVKDFGKGPDTYRCVRQWGDGGPNTQEEEEFDVGYVMRTIRDAEQLRRQS